MTTGMLAVVWSVLSRRQTSAPSIFGRSLSSRMTSGGSCFTRESALAPSRAIWTMCPRPDSTFTISRTTSGSSSITSTRAMLLLVDHRSQAGLGDRGLPVALVRKVRANATLAIDECALGHRVDAPRCGDRADVTGPLRRIEEHLERHAVRQRLGVDGKRFLERDLGGIRQLRVRCQRIDDREDDVAPVAIRRECDDDEVITRHVLGHLVELRLLGLADAAPRRPE